MNLAALDRLRFDYINGRSVPCDRSFGPAAAAPYKSNQIRIEYDLPKNPAHQPIYERLKQVRALEQLQTPQARSAYRARCFSRFPGAMVN